jgi:ABC-type multidrug transport system ATPase subunit
MNNNKKAYISKVHLKGYKSIRDFEIDFKPGLNVIIGPNGSGKTNFQAFTNDIMWERFEDIESENFEYSYDFKRGNDVITKDIVANRREDKYFQEKILTKLFSLNGKGIRETTYRISDRNSFFESENLLTDIHDEYPEFIYMPKFIKFSDPKENYLKEPILIRFNKIKDESKYYFSPNSDSYLIIPILDKTKLKSLEIDSTNFFEAIGIDSQVLDLLQSFTPIQDIRIDKKLFRNASKNDTLIVDNIIPEFFVNNEWFTFNQLSDGTKRIFYILTSINFEKDIILLEEPELGIHPHQLYLLMQFIKEQAEEKQIIITTHSPEVLNILKMDELDSIIITSYDTEKGTQMHKLSEKQIKKAQKYMETTGFLSNYWVHSNLEDIDEKN